MVSLRLRPRARPVVARQVIDEGYLKVRYGREEAHAEEVLDGSIEATTNEADDSGGAAIE